MKRALGWRPSLLASFSILGALITAVTAIAFAWILERRLEQAALWQEAQSAADQVALILSPNLSQADFTTSLGPARYAQIDKLVHQDILREHIVRVKIWNRAGLLLYSDDGTLVGQQFPVSDELGEALGGEIATDVSSLNKSENASERQLYDRLLEVYVPITPAGADQAAGAYEIYHDLSVLEPSIVATQRFVWTSAALGFLLLYGSLFTLVRNASQELSRRNEENKRLFQQEQIRRTELSALYDLSRALADALAFETILGLVTRHAVETVEVTFCRVAILEGDDIAIRAAYPVRLLDQSLDVGARYPLALSHSFKHVLEQNELIIIPAENPDLSEVERGELFLGAAKTLCLVPLRAGDRALGLLLLAEARNQEREPFSAEKLRLARSIGDQAASALYRVELFSELEQSYLGTVLALANAVDAKDTYTADHAQHLASMALIVGQAMGLNEQQLEDLRYAAILHDIGKIGVPDAVLQKPSRLDPAEWALMREHPSIGARILAPVPRLASAALIVRHHHERYDGSGYPDGLSGQAIPLGARILTVVDSYSAIIDRRVYKEGSSHAEAVSELRKHAGTQFDPQVVAVFLAKFDQAGKLEGSSLSPETTSTPSTSD
jgi:HD-GYP domain-containing protein (c-di-GMP phosphodiesterase class II)